MFGGFVCFFHREGRRRERTHTKGGSSGSTPPAETGLYHGSTSVSHEKVKIST